MKQISIFITAILTAISLNSCSDNDDNQPQMPAAKEIAGCYTGSMAATVMGSDLNFENVDVEITAVDESHVEITIAPFGNAPMVLPEINIKNVAVAGSNGLYALDATEFSGSSPDGKNYSGTIQGSFHNGLTLNMELHYGSMPYPMICKYNASSAGSNKK